MKKYSSLFVAIVASVSLMAQEKPEKSKYWPFEVQVGASFMGYHSHDSSWMGYSRNFSPDNPRLAPSIKVAIDPIGLPFGSILLSAGYRLKNDVPLNYYSDLSHEEQTQFGLTLRIETSTNFELGVGLDYRRDWMKVPQLHGTDTQDTAWRPWLRANARYMFDKGTNVTPFIGLEAGFALSNLDVDNNNHYRDYAINSGNYFLGAVPNSEIRTPESFTRGHFPAWEVAAVAGIRFGRHGVGAPKVKAVPVVPVVPVIEAEKVVVPDNSEARRAEEARRKAEEDARIAAAEARRKADEEARRRLEEQVTEVDGLRIHFATNSSATTAADRALVKRWVEKHKGIDTTAITVIGHCDIRGLPEHNQQLSMQRARALAYLLRMEGINIPASNIIGRSFSQPIANNETPEGLATDRRSEVTINHSKFRITPSSTLEGRRIVENR
ncbi:MAG: OmpA family protein [Holophagaceae bacterium]|nr:OmpA family protein [Holophagaceae bacterium]